MNPVKQIGRWQIPILSVLLVQQPKGWRVWLQRFEWLRQIEWLKPRYSVIMNNGQRLQFTEDEKQEYDEALSLHAEVLQVYGMAKGLGRIGM